MGLLRLGQRFSVTEYLATRGDNFELKKAKDGHGLSNPRSPLSLPETFRAMQRS
jgi:hypothetical protein